YTGATTLNGGTLALTGTGSVATSSGVAVGATAAFDISQTTSGASVARLSGSGAVNLGGDVSGGLTISGTETLSGANTYTGTTTINAASTLNLSGAGDISGSTVAD